MKPRKTNILLGIPCGDNRVHVPVAAFVALAMKHNTSRKCPFKFSVDFLPNHSPTEYARNCIVSQFLEKKQMDALWFIDSDSNPTESSFDLLQIDADIVAGIVPIFTSGDLNTPSFCYNFYHQVHNPSEPGRDFLPFGLNGHKQPVEVDGAGTACMIIKRKVLEDRRMWLGEKVEDVVPMFRWHRTLTGNTDGTDDLDFCRRARALGYKIVVSPAVRWGHFKEVDLEWIIKKIDTIYKQPVTKLPTINEWNAVASLFGQPPKFVYQHPLNPSPSKASSEAPPESPAEALIVPTAAN